MPIESFNILFESTQNKLQYGKKKYLHRDGGGGGGGGVMMIRNIKKIQDFRVLILSCCNCLKCITMVVQVTAAFFLHLLGGPFSHWSRG